MKGLENLNLWKRLNSLQIVSWYTLMLLSTRLLPTRHHVVNLTKHSTFSNCGLALYTFNWQRYQNVSLNYINFNQDSVEHIPFHPLNTFPFLPLNTFPFPPLNTFSPPTFEHIPLPLLNTFPFHPLNTFPLNSLNTFPFLP